MKIFLKIRFFFRDFFSYVSGNLAYENYKTHALQHHAKEKILDKKTFLRAKQKAKWNKISRCC